MTGFFEGFEERNLRLVTGESVRFRIGGEGPPVVLLHGHPRTHTTWYRVAPLLAAAGSTVVCPDLRGYGASSTPEPGRHHAAYSQSAMAADVLALRWGTSASPSPDTTAAATWRCASHWRRPLP